MTLNYLNGPATRKDTDGNFLTNTDMVTFDKVTRLFTIAPENLYTSDSPAPPLERY
jgi:hypothetical protein